MKKLTTVIVSFMFAIALCYPAFGAATTVPGQKCITITGLDDGDATTDWWASKVGYPNKLDIWCIVFYPSATGDRLYVNDGGLDADVIYDSGLCSDTYDPRVVYYPPGMKVEPVIDTSDCTFGTDANVSVKIYFR